MGTSKKIGHGKSQYFELLGHPRNRTYVKIKTHAIEIKAPMPTITHLKHRQSEIVMCWAMGLKEIHQVTHMKGAIPLAMLTEKGWEETVRRTLHM